MSRYRSKRAWIRQGLPKNPVPPTDLHIDLVVQLQVGFVRLILGPGLRAEHQLALRVQRLRDVLRVWELDGDEHLVGPLGPYDLRMQAARTRGDKKAQVKELGRCITPATKRTQRVTINTHSGRLTCERLTPSLIRVSASPQTGAIRYRLSASLPAITTQLNQNAADCSKQENVELTFTTVR